mmetsp:Transcript_34981/g.36385  ORF Transcript_34981/g.36385 Transcript_34981/m.36385 type:complete len:84 (-) Transcript_34981:22-273(-)
MYQSNICFLYTIQWVSRGLNGDLTNNLSTPNMKLSNKGSNINQPTKSKKLFDGILSMKIRKEEAFFTGGNRKLLIETGFRFIN